MRSSLLFSLLAIGACAGGSEVAPDAAPRGVAVSANRHDTSPPLAMLDGVRATPHADDDDELEFAPARTSFDPAVQTTAAVTAPAIDTSFEGLGAGSPGVPYATPPDTNTAVGATQIVEIVNDSMAVWTKSGQLVWGPKPTNAIFSGFGGPCETSNDGDAKIRYDAMANRWVAVWFSYFNAPYGLCMAVSATSDATGSWHRYFWQFNSQTDSPMLGVWSDGYYVTINGFLTNDNLQIPVCAFDRTAMLAGTAATRQCFSTNALGSIPVPADVTGATAPPAGEPELVVNFDRSSSNAMNAFELHVDWTTPANSTLTSVGPLAIAAYSNPTGPAPQPDNDPGVAPGVNNFPFAYRNFGDHESFVLADEVSVNDVNAPRWYELRLSGGNPVVYQQGTYAPGDGLHRFMPSAAMDRNGDLALGFSVSSLTVYPGIRFTGRLASDPLGQMTQGEGTIITGAGAQPGGGRWGDYSSMSVDPVDGCTFWYSQEYYGNDAGNGWRTRNASFHLPGCTVTPPPPPSGIVNGDFETAVLTPWTAAGTASIVSTAHGGAHAAQVGSTSPTTDSSIAQTFTAPSTGGNLSFWYKVTCPDTVQYDWATATLKDNTAGTTTTPLAKTCTNTGAWVQVSTPIVAGHSYTLTLANHDDNYAGDATYTIFDDVAIAQPPPPPPSGIGNGGFETGTLPPWTSTGVVGVASTAHSGAYAAVTGKIGAPTSGDSSVAQTFTAPSTGGTLSFWYQVVCPDTVSYDWATAVLKDTTAGTTKTVLAKTCTNNKTWVQVSTALTAGHAYTLTLTSHDDNYAGDATYAYFDDVTIK